jgi:hypothetical protein
LLLQLQELDINTTEEDLKNPKEGTVMRLFEHFMELLMGVTKEEINQVGRIAGTWRRATTSSFHTI